MKSKPEEKTMTTQVNEEKPFKFRYACEGCTGVALRSTNTMTGVKISCQNCGKEQITKAENYLVV